MLAESNRLDFSFTLRMMRQPFVITTPFPTVEEVARRSGVSPERTKELVEMAKRFMSGDIGSAQKQKWNKASKKSSVASVGRKKRK